MSFILALIIAYLIGSIPFAVIVSRAMGLSDPRQYGSGNPGATNVLRSGNKLAALLTLLGDALKGTLVVMFAMHFQETLSLGALELAAVSLAVFLGHVFSVFLKFQGGKGVATAAGVLFGINWILGLAVLIVWIAVAAISRYSSLAAICAAISAPILSFLLLASTAWTAATLCMCAILIWRHAENIRRLMAGTEGRIGKKKTATPG